MFTLVKDIYYSFPFQLLLLSFKRYQFLLFFWIFLFVIVIGKFGAVIGLPAVFLDPEYLGKVSYLSFFVAGMGFGAMFITWNVVMYILHSHRFPFMASLQYPLGMFILNNSLIPAVFLVSYFSAIVLFQTQNEFQGFPELFMELCGFTAGFLLLLVITATYFNFANKNTGSILAGNLESTKKKKAYRRVQFTEEMDAYRPNRVDYYVTNKFHIRHTRTVESYDPRLHQLVFKRHHWNAFMAFIFSFALIIAAGFFIESPVFQFPMAASSFLFACIMMSLFGMFLYWTGGWGTTAIIVFLIAVNYLTKYDLFGLQSQVYGLNYKTEKAKYDLGNFYRLSSDSMIDNDKKYFLQILENWKKKNIDPLHPDKKPVLYFVNASVGGLRAGMFTTLVLQNCDSLAGGKLFDKTFLISGASGGMFGTTYLRELFLQKKNGAPIDLHDRKYAFNVAKDLLNPLAVSILSNDILVPFHTFKTGGYRYYKDRGYIFEKFYCQNTGMQFNKTLNDYKQDEFEARIPLLIYHTTVVNDSRRFFISPQPVSFLMRPFGKNAEGNDYEVDGIDFCRFFEKQDGKNLQLISAMRMDATFPVILPNPVLPSDPATSIMDGGIVDNTGAEVTFRLLQTFKDWIDTNTDGVVVIQIRDSQKQNEPEEQEHQTFLSRFFDPIGSVYTNIDNVQDFSLDQKLNYMDDELRGKLKFVLFEYTSASKTARAAMSFHLTTRDKNDIVNSLSRDNNVAAFNKLKILLEK